MSPEPLEESGERRTAAGEVVRSLDYHGAVASKDLMGWAVVALSIVGGLYVSVLLLFVVFVVVPSGVRGGEG